MSLISCLFKYLLPKTCCVDALLIISSLISFHPETVLFPFGGVNLHNYSSTY